MILLACGSRDWDCFLSAKTALEGIIQHHGPPSLLIHGDARGADTFFNAAAGYALIPRKAFPADWEKHGRSAGPIRNRQMYNEGRPTHLIALTSTFRVNSGTVDMCMYAEEQGCEEMACLTSLDQVNKWVDKGCPFYPFSWWVPMPAEGMGRV